MDATAAGGSALSMRRHWQTHQVRRLGEKMMRWKRLSQERIERAVFLRHG